MPTRADGEDRMEAAMEESLQWEVQVLLLKWVQLKKAIKGQG